MGDRNEKVGITDLRKKRPYRKPILLTHGNVAQLTKGGGSAGADIGAMQPKPML
jgi:hypothetical protein